MKNRNLDHVIHWGTPTIFKKKLYEKHNIDFDPCPYMHDITKWDGLKIEWGERNFINPGYELKLKTAFVLKAIEESRKGKLCVMLLPVSTSTKLYHNHIKPNMNSCEFIYKRLPFIGNNDKGQRVNWDVTTKETIPYLKKDPKNEGKFIEVQIPLYVKQAGQHDSMIIIFDGRPKGMIGNIKRFLKL